MGAVSMLWPTLQIDPEETLLSYADRLSVLHTGRGMVPLLKDRGIHVEHFVSGPGLMPSKLSLRPPGMGRKISRALQFEYRKGAVNSEEKTSRSLSFLQELLGTAQRAWSRTAATSNGVFV